MSVEPIILAVETATLGGSVCLFQRGTVLASRLGEVGVSHSNSLLKDIESVLSEAKLSLAHVALFAAATGPGSFTGLRIGLATVKGLANTLNKPCAGVGTLAAVAVAAAESANTVALLPAGRGELFGQMFSVASTGEVTAQDDAVHLSPARMLQRYEHLQTVVWAGEGAQLNQELINGNGQAGWTIAPPEQLLAQHVAALAHRKLSAGETQTADSLTAIYVRPSDAELKINVLNS